MPPSPGGRGGSSEVLMILIRFCRFGPGWDERIKLPARFTFTQYPFPGFMVSARTYLPLYPKKPDVMIPPGIEAIPDVLTGRLIEPSRFQPGSTTTVSSVRILPVAGTLCTDGYFNQYPT